MTGSQLGEEEERYIRATVLPLEPLVHDCSIFQTCRHYDLTVTDQKAVAHLKDSVKDVSKAVAHSRLVTHSS